MSTWDALHEKVTLSEYAFGALVDACWNAARKRERARIVTIIARHVAKASLSTSHGKAQRSFARGILSEIDTAEEVKGNVQP